METTLFGKPSNILGIPSKELILRGTSLKFQQGGKFIDLLKANGSFDIHKILKTADTEESITQDGIYLVGEKVVICIESVKIALEKLVNSYISYLEEQTEITPEQKQIALLNSGFYYKTLKEAQDTKIDSGIIFVLENNMFYLAKQGVLTPYTFTTVEKETVKKQPIEENKSSVELEEQFQIEISTQDNIITFSSLNDIKNPTKMGLKLAKSHNFKKDDLVFIEKGSIVINEIKDAETNKYYFELSDICDTKTTIIYYNSSNSKISEHTIEIGQLKSSQFDKTENHSYYEHDLENKKYLKSKIIGINQKLVETSDDIFDIIVEAISYGDLANKKIIGGGSSLMPPNTIMIYYGESIPYGWIKCDGTNGTPNMPNLTTNVNYIMKL